MGIANLHDYIARVEKAVRDNLSGAVVVALIQVDVDIRPDRPYWERIYAVAWQRGNECGTHRVCINSNDEEMCVWGHYTLSKEEALMDVLNRAGFDRMVSK